MPSEVDTLQSDLAELQARLKAAGLDYSLPSEAKKADDSKAAAASAPSKAKPDKAASGERINFFLLPDATFMFRMCQLLANIKKKTETIDNYFPYRTPTAEALRNWLLYRYTAYSHQHVFMSLHVHVAHLT